VTFAGYRFLDPLILQDKRHQVALIETAFSINKRRVLLHWRGSEIFGGEGSAATETYLTHSFPFYAADINLLFCTFRRWLPGSYQPPGALPRYPLVTVPNRDRASLRVKPVFFFATHFPPPSTLRKLCFSPRRMLFTHWSP